jgi:PAS domain S-box-containing protein
MSTAPNRIRVLHVDDDPGFADLAATFLEREDERFDIETATDVDEGMTRVADEQYDCIVSDYDMPGRTGIDFLRRVRDQHPDLPFILYTGKGSEEIASDAISAGATDYLQKETGTGQYELLANRIENVVSQAQSQRAERHLRELAENTGRILYIFNHDWSELLFINSAYEELWGRSVDTLRSTPTDFLNGIHPEDREQAREAMTQMSAGETVELEFRVDTTEGYDRWVHVRGEPIRDETGDVARVAGFGTDVTDQKELQQTLQRRTERLQEAQRVAGVGSWEWDAASDTVTWSEETYRIFGRDPEELAAPSFEDWLTAVHPADRETAQQAVGEAMETGSFPTFEHRVQQPDGTVQWVKCRGDVTVVDGEPARITGTILDISEQVAYEQHLEHQRSVLESVVETLPEGILVVDDDREVFTYNQQFVQLWNLPEAVVQRGDYAAILEAILDTLERPAAFQETVEQFEDHPEATGHERVDLTDGRTVQGYTAPATDEDGTYYGRIWVFQDEA